jgi:hypothetical protein
MGRRIRRREFIASTAWAGFSVSALAGSAEDSPDRTLLALAEVIVPDRDGQIWLRGSVADSFLRRLETLDETGKAQVEKAVRTVEAAAIHAKNKQFSALRLQDRTMLVRTQLGVGEEFGSGFSLIHRAAMNAFYTSETGQRRTGYHDTTQFVGYPEYVQLSESWE